MVLVTGANGFIGSHVCNELLQLGFNVRGTVRDVTKCAWLPEALKRQRPKGDFMLVSLPDMEKEGAFDAAVEGECVEALTYTSGRLTPLQASLL